MRPEGVEDSGAVGATVADAVLGQRRVLLQDLVVVDLTIAHHREASGDDGLFAGCVPRLNPEKDEMVKTMRSTKRLFDYKKFSATETLLDMPASVHPLGSEIPLAPPKPVRWFPSFRFLTAVLLCMCYASVHMMNSNMGMAIVCMVNSTEFDDANATLDPEAAPRVNWNPDEQGYIFSAFNAGILCMLVTGFLADKLNAKIMIIVSVVLASAANVAIPLMAQMK
uniref:MFS domain-containing protein n=1 Tax=Steinernema glaseri TaxID=37863 RepID=A0A1I8A654_9BILA